MTIVEHLKSEIKNVKTKEEVRAALYHILQIITDDEQFRVLVAILFAAHNFGEVWDREEELN